MSRIPPREGAQAVVEFGVVTLIFVLLVMGIFDFGLLLNSWLGVGSASGDLARRAAVGTGPDVLGTAASKVFVPDSTGPAQLSLWVRIKCNDATLKTCNAYDANGDYWAQVDTTQSTYKLTGAYMEYQPNGTIVTGTDSTLTTYVYPNGSPVAGKAPPVMGDLLKARVSAPKFQVITPLIRPFFGCPGTQTTPCYVPLQSDTNARYEGIFVSS